MVDKRKILVYEIGYSPPAKIPAPRLLSNCVCAEAGMRTQFRIALLAELSENPQFC